MKLHGMMAQWGTGNLRSCWLMVHAQEYREMQAGKDITVETFIFILLRGCGSHDESTREKVCTLVSSLSMHMLFLSRDPPTAFQDSSGTMDAKPGNSLTVVVDSACPEG